MNSRDLIRTLLLKPGECSHKEDINRNIFYLDSQALIARQFTSNF